MGHFRTASARTHLLVSLVAGVVVGAVAAIAVGWKTAGLLGWSTAAAVFLIWTWSSIWTLDADETAHDAQLEDSSRVVRDLVLVATSVGAMFTVAAVIFRAHASGSVRIGLGLTCIAASWAVLHTVLTLRYARLYYAEPRGGIDFKQDADPTFRDFAYVAFTVGMTFQVSDTDVRKPTIRSTILGHALLSFVFATLIIAVTINVLAGFGR